MDESKAHVVKPSPNTGNTQPPPSQELNRFKRFWKNGGRFLTISTPLLVLVHYAWYKIQFMDDIIPENQRKEVIRAGPILIHKDQTISFIKPGDFAQPFEIEDRKAGK